MKIYFLSIYVYMYILYYVYIRINNLRPVSNLCVTFYVDLTDAADRGVLYNVTVVVISAARCQTQAYNTMSTSVVL